MLRQLELGGARQTHQVKACTVTLAVDAAQTLGEFFLYLAASIDTDVRRPEDQSHLLAGGAQVAFVEGFKTPRLKC